MRPIKFRGMDIKGNWHYGNLSVLLIDIGYAKKGSYISNKSGMPFAYNVRPETVGEFTGLLDVKGNEIWEGDVVEFPPFNKEFCEGEYLPRQRFTVDLSTLRFWLKEEDFGYEGELLLAPEECQVIGNIYENPELLGGAK